MTLDVVQNLIPGNTISGFDVINGVTASIAGEFVGNAAGVSTIDIIATDDGDPAAATSVTMFIQVL